MADQPAVRARCSVVEQGQMADEWYPIGGRDQHSEGMAINERRQTLWAGFLEMLGQVHGDSISYQVFIGVIF